MRAASEAVSEAVNIFSGCIGHNPYSVTTQEAYSVSVIKNPYSVFGIAFLGIPMLRIPYLYYKVSVEPLAYGPQKLRILRVWLEHGSFLCTDWGARLRKLTEGHEHITPDRHDTFTLCMLLQIKFMTHVTRCPFIVLFAR